MWRLSTDEISVLTAVPLLSVPIVVFIRLAHGIGKGGTRPMLAVGVRVVLIYLRALGARYSYLPWLPLRYHLVVSGKLRRWFLSI